MQSVNIIVFVNILHNRPTNPKILYPNICSKPTTATLVFVQRSIGRQEWFSPPPHPTTASDAKFNTEPEISIIAQQNILSLCDVFLELEPLCIFFF